MEAKSCIIENAKLFTCDPNCQKADSMIVEDGFIRWVGKREDRPACEFPKIDLSGARVIPGFVDVHMHPVMLADFSKQISALPPNVYSIEELVKKIHTWRMTHGTDEWCLGWGYDEGKFQERRSPTRYDLDRGCSDAPVSIMRTCGHIRCVNSFALNLAGITRDTPTRPAARSSATKTASRPACSRRTRATSSRRSCPRTTRRPPSKTSSIWGSF